MITEIKSHYANITTFVSRTSHKLRVNGRHIDPLRALHEIMAWLARAQDATPDDGVAQAYFVKKQAWGASYPETTGYIIPTFFDYAKLAGKPEFVERAIRMADWLVKIQLSGGGIQASTIDAPKVVPTIFNTGMVIFGWVRAFEETKQQQYLDAATKAADWLTSVQDDDGAWRKFGSTQTASAVNTYNTRVAWALLAVHCVTNNSDYRSAAIKNLDWAQTQQFSNGWLENNCLLDNRCPYTHTIAYAMRGFLVSYHNLKNSPLEHIDKSPLEGGQGGVTESSTTTKPANHIQVGVSNPANDRYLKAAQAIFAGLQPRIKNDGFLAARFDCRWHPAAKYCCLTGNAQLAINAFLLAKITDESQYANDAQKLVQFVVHTVDMNTPDPNIRGGIAGSFPIGGKYHPNQYPNWAAKFTADAVMKYISLNKIQQRK